MSASREEKIRAREEKRRQEERADRRAMTLYTVVGAVVVIAAIAMVIWTSGVLQRNLTAVEINGTKYTSADVKYYFDTAYSSEVNTYTSLYYVSPFDTSVSTKKQVYDAESGQTWYDYLMDKALNLLTADTALAAQAKTEGYTLSEDAQTQLDAIASQLEVNWMAYGYQSRDAYIRAAFGAYMSYDRLLELMNMSVLASDYATNVLTGTEHGDADYQAYYSEHASELDTYTFHQFLFQARVSTTDDAGNTIEMTEEETAAALEEEKAAQKALAEELLAKLEAGEKAEDLAEEYADQLYSSVLNRAYVGSTVKTQSVAYGDWVLDDARRSGDTTLAEYDGGTVYNYYVVQYVGRELVTTPTADVRHILVAAEQDEGASEPTQEQYDAAYEKAEELLEQWKSGEATEDSFAALAVENSADTGSAANGGLISDISTASTYVDTFKDWALDASRQAGDTGIVQNTGSSVKGWHIMYYVASGDPIWKETTAAALANQDYNDLVAKASEGWSTSQGLGMNFVEG